MVHPFTILLVTLSFCANAQLIRNKGEQGFLKKSTDHAIYDAGELYFQEKNYEGALEEFSKLEPAFPDEQELLFRIAICSMYKPGGNEKSLACFKKVDRNKYKKFDYAFYYGKSLHLNAQFDSAIVQLTAYIDQGKNKAFKAEAEKIIRWCNNSKTIKPGHTEIKITNLDTVVNTSANEYVPIISPDESMLIFTYRGERSMGGLQQPIINPDNPVGEYYEDIFYSAKDSIGRWKTPEPIPGSINTRANEACISLTPDGQTLFVFESTEEDEGAIYESILEGTEWSRPTKITGEINSPSWEGSISVTADGKTAIFSSERPGGKGGKDLYMATLDASGNWKNVRNMGDSINTIYDEDAPYIHPSGEFLIFSSTGHNSMGNYDIFISNISNDTVYSKANNLGAPLNTPGNDVFYMLTADGKKGYYSSAKTDGKGGQDIYVVEPGYVGEAITLVLTKGQVTLDDKPVTCAIELSSATTNKIIGNYTTNSATGNYMINVPKGHAYELKFKLDSNMAAERKLATDSLEGFFETTVDVEFYTPAYLAKLKHRADSIQIAEVKNNLNKEQYKFNEILAVYGDFSDPDLTYTLQIGAFNLKDNFDYSKILKVGKIRKQKLEDGITRFVIGEFETLEQAEFFRAEVYAAGINDVFITAMYREKRYLLNELVHTLFLTDK
jgi:Tol biopolymer transport system component